MSENSAIEFIRKPYLKKGKASYAQIIEKAPMEVGGNKEDAEASKFYVTLRFSKDGVTKERKLASKEYEYLDEEDVIEIIKIYDKARKEGFPVPPTTRYFLTKDYQPAILMTDMTQGGKYKIWGFNDSFSKDEVATLKSMGLKEGDFSKVKQLSEEIMKKANEKRHVLGFQNYHIRQDTETGKIDIVILDLDDRFLEPVKGLVDSNNKELQKFLQYAWILSTGIVSD